MMVDGAGHCWCERVEPPKVKIDTRIAQSKTLEDEGAVSVL